MNDKKKYIAIVTSFGLIHSGMFHHHRILFKKLSNNFEKIFVINSQNLRFFPKIAKSINMEKNDDEFIEPENIPKNFFFFNPKNSNEFSKFLEDKELIIINNFTKHFFDLKVQFLLKKHKIKQIQVSNLGTIGFGIKTSSKHLIKSLIFHFNQTFFNKFTVFLTNLGLVSKLEIRFFSNLRDIKNMKKNFFKRFLYNKKLLWAKEIKLINSRTYDIFLENKFPISEDYIVHLDANLNHRHELELRGVWDEEKTKLHYYYLEKFLKKLSNEFKKEVLITIHPAYDLKEHQKYFKDFKVLKYKTSECIYKSFMVTSFDSGAITDAILLKKKIIGLQSNFMSINEIEHSKIYPQNVGYLHLNTKDDYSFDKNELLEKMNNNIKNYDKFISNYHCFKPNISGSDEIVQTIKERFFDVNK